MAKTTETKRAAKSDGGATAKFDRPEPVKKIDAMRAMIAKEDWIGALRLAASFGSLGDEKVRIMRAWEAVQRPDFQRQLGRDPEALLADGIAALRERYVAKAPKK